MLIQKAYKFELIVNGEQSRLLCQYAGCCRFVYNKALVYQQSQYALDNSFKFSYTKLANLLPQWKLEHTFLLKAPSQTLQQSLKHLETSFRNFFSKRSAFPRFKKRGTGDSIKFPQGFKLEQGNNRVFLPKLGYLRYRNSREVIGEVKNITLSQVCGKWLMSVQTEQEVDLPVHGSQSIIGVDLGIAKLATLSDGTVFNAVNSFKCQQVKLARYQRALSRKVKFSSNWKKQKQKISKCHHQISNIRKDYLHKLTSIISQNHAIVCIEDLQVSNMSKSAKGDNLKHGNNNVKAKSGLNRSILDQGWFELRRQLTYKQGWLGGEVLAVDPKYTSQRCSCCSSVSKLNRKSQSRFECTSCGYTANADLNAARNILAAGHAVLACGEIVQQDNSVKQEPSEGITYASK